MKLPPPNLPHYKFSRKNKNVKIWDQKCLIWVFLTKNTIFGYFWATILKELLSYFKSAPSNLNICKISRKNKNAKIWDQKYLIWIFLTKNAIFGYFWTTILKELSSYLKSAPSNLFTCKISRQNKNAKFGTKNAWFWYFWARILKNNSQTWNQHP